jgi:hypothetical protein
MRPVNTPATNYLFRIREVEKVSKQRIGLFHSMVAKLLFVVKRARPDILLTILFWTTRVKEPDHDNWRKLVRLLSYLKRTENLNLTLKI